MKRLFCTLGLCLALAGCVRPLAPPEADGSVTVDGVAYAMSRQLYEAETPAGDVAVYYEYSVTVNGRSHRCGISDKAGGGLPFGLGNAARENSRADIEAACVRTVRDVLSGSDDDSDSGYSPPS